MTQMGILLQEEKNKSLKDYSKTSTIEGEQIGIAAFLHNIGRADLGEDHSEIPPIGDLTAPKEVPFLGDRSRQQVQKETGGIEELLRQEIEQTISDTSFKGKLRYKIEQIEARRKTIDIILVGTNFGGGMGILLSGIIFANGFLSWMGVLFMALGLIHLITSS